MQIRRRKEFQLVWYRSDRGSTLALTLILVGVLAVSVAAMLGSVRHLVRSADDKIAEEECYFTAMAGLNTIKAWIMEPALASQQAGATIGNAMQEITSGALNMSNTVIQLRTDPAILANIDAADIASEYNSLPGRQTIEGGRRVVLYNWGGPSSSKKPIVIRRGDANYGTPSDRLFDATLTGDGSMGSQARSWVDQIRITTPYRGTGNPPPDSVRQTSLIIEVVAKTAGAGIEKTRILTGRVLVIPPDQTTPPAQSGAAIVAGAGLSISGNSNYDVHWGTVLAKGDMKVLGLTYDKAANKLLFDFNESNSVGKYTGVGIPDPFGTREKWVRFLAGGELQNKQGQPIFKDGAGTNGAPVTDLIAQLHQSQLSPGTPFAGVSASVTTVGEGPSAQTVTPLTLEGVTPSGLSSLEAEGMFFDSPESPADAAAWTEGRGAFVQKSNSAKTQVDASFDSLDYQTWKNFAIKMKGYVRPAGNGVFVNATGQRLYVTAMKTLTTVSSGNTPLTDLKQISMKNLLPASGDTTDIPDRMLFVDNPEGKENSTTKASVKINAADDFFWKGMIFISGDLDMAGTGNTPAVLAKNPDQWANGDPGELVKPCLLDGILRLTGTCNKNGNPMVYGSIVAGKRDGTGTFTSGGTPEIYYNERCRNGIFRPTVFPLVPGVVSGPIVEVSALRT